MNKYGPDITPYLDTFHAVKAVECKGCMTFVQFKEYELECCVLVGISCFEDLYKKFRIKCC